MHANEVVDAIATPFRGTEHRPLACAGFGQCAARRPPTGRGRDQAALHAASPRTLTHFPGA